MWLTISMRAVLGIASVLAAAYGVIHPDGKVPARLRDATSELTVVVSFPVYTSNHGRWGRRDRRVAVINLDSKSPGAYELVISSPLRGEITSDLRRMAQVASRLIF